MASKKLTKAYSELRSAEQALCYAAAAFIRGAGVGATGAAAASRDDLRTAVNRWSKASEGVGKLLGAELRSPDRATGGGGGTPLVVNPSSTSEGKDEQGKRTTKDVNQTKTWLTPYSDAWTVQYQGTPNFGLLARTLKPLHDAHGPDEVLTRWTLYLKETPGRYASPRRFAETFGEWDRRKAPERRDGPRRAADVMAPLPDETPDQYLARVGSA